MSIISLVHKKGISGFKIGWHYFNQKFNFLIFPAYLVTIKKVKAEILKGDFEKAISELFRSKYLAPGQIRPEFNELIKIVRNLNPKKVLEIGTSNGGSLFLFAQSSDPLATIASIDLPGGHFGGGYVFWKKWLYYKFARPSQELILLRGDSHSDKMLSEIKRTFGDNGIDFLFIDADHTYEGVKKDFEMYSPLVRKGGVIAFHDIALPPDDTYGTNKFWHEIKSSFKTRELIDDINQRGFGIGVLFV